jgi:hypothetical protein
MPKTDLMPDMMVDLAKDADHVLDLSNQRMRDFIKYYFELSLPKLPSMKKDALQNILRPLLLRGDNDEAQLETIDNLSVRVDMEAKTGSNIAVPDDHPLLLCGENDESWVETIGNEELI